MQGCFQCCIEHLVSFFPESLWPHTAAKQIEAEVEIARIVRVIAEKRHCRGAKLIDRFFGSRHRPANGLTKTGERVAQHLGINRFFRVEVEIQSGWCI